METFSNVKGAELWRGFLQLMEVVKYDAINRFFKADNLSIKMT